MGSKHGMWFGPGDECPWLFLPLLTVVAGVGRTQLPLYTAIAACEGEKQRDTSSARFHERAQVGSFERLFSALYRPPAFALLI